MIMSRTRPVMRRISQVATRPPSLARTSRWEMTPLSVPASIARTCWCMWGGKKSMTCTSRSARCSPDLLVHVGREEVDDAVDRLGGVDGVDRREDEVAGLGGGQGGVH